MIHLYAFAPAGTRLPAGGGIGGGPLTAHCVADVAAVVSTVRDGETTLDRAAVVAHGLVVERLRETADAVLPVRFGERFTDRDELVGAVGDRIPTLRQSLARVRGCAEFGVRMLAPDDDLESSAATDGSGYMRMRLAALERAAAVAGELHEPLARCARASVVAADRDHDVAYLVGNGDRARFEAVLASFVDAHPDVTVVCTGPWAPYSFVEAG